MHARGGLQELRGTLYELNTKGNESHVSSVPKARINMDFQIKTTEYLFS